MLYEMRSYYVVPGRLPDIVARFRDHTTGIFERVGIKNIGYWTELVGRNDLLVYIIAFEDMADRETKWEKFITDPEWIEAKTRTEADGQLVRYLENRFLAPTDFSPLQ
jgi:hypothetical protein